MSSKSTLSFVLGALFGAALAVILTPWRGEEVRDLLTRDPVDRKLKRVRKKLAQLEERLEKRLEAERRLRGISEEDEEAGESPPAEESEGSATPADA